MSEEYKEKIKQFLERQLSEYQVKIKKLKRKRKAVKVLFVSLIIVSVVSSTSCATLAGFAMPIFVIPMLSGIAGLTTVLSVKFNLAGKKQELNETIDQLDKIKRQIDYIVSCNGNFSENEYKQLLLELTKFN